MDVELITIGDEILIGQIIDTNSAWMAKELNKLGIHVKQITSLADHPADILAGLALAADRSDIVLITGGLGPTKDDVTKQTLASYFNCGLRRDEVVLQHVTGIFEKFNRPMLEINRRQADVLAICEVLFNDLGTAPGMWLHHQGTYFAIMPGVPFEMKHIMEQRVLPRLARLEGRVPIWHHTILTGGIGESFLSKEIADIEDALPAHLHLAYLPKPGFVRLRLTATGADWDILKADTAHVVEQLKVRLGRYFLADGDVSVEEVIVEDLVKYGCKLTTAESCTGGNIARLLTAIPGSSSAFVGGAVTYSNELKIQLLGVKCETIDTYGAVSEETVREMAVGAKRNFGADYAVAVSGIAGPGGGTVEKPVGQVWIAVASKNQVNTKVFQFGNDRVVNIERASSAALLMLLALIKTENIA